MYLDVTSMLTNAQEMAQTYPDTFYAPDSAELQSIRPGSAVKVCASPEVPKGEVTGERFWTLVEKLEGDYICATVENNLIVVDWHVGFKSSLKHSTYSTSKNRHLPSLHKASPRCVIRGLKEHR